MYQSDVDRPKGPVYQSDVDRPKGFLCIKVMLIDVKVSCVSK